MVHNIHSRQQYNNNNYHQQQRNNIDPFSKQSTQGINFAEYSKIPVSRSGGNNHNDPGALISHPPLPSFQNLKDCIPSFLFDNLTMSDRMGYSIPTPIQCNAIPIGVSCESDFMGCAQTGSGKVSYDCLEARGFLCDLCVRCF